jgi:hypothetical protein
VPAYPHSHTRPSLHNRYHLFAIFFPLFPCTRVPQAGAAAILLYIYILYGVALAKVWVENTYFLPPAWQWSLLGAVGTTVAFAIGAGIGLGSGMKANQSECFFQNMIVCNQK